MFYECKSIYANSTQGAEAMIPGHVILDERQVNLLPVWANVVGCLAFIVVFRVAGYLLLRFYRNPRKSALK